MDNDKTFLRRAKSVSYLNALSLKERLGVGHFLLLTKIVASKIKGESLPNVKWLQTELSDEMQPFQSYKVLTMGNIT
jgi:hypothetical protein